jgi:L-histidine N-alpha-methyltransferase
MTDSESGKIDEAVVEAIDQDLVDEILEGLRGSPRTLPTRLFYDRRGSELFEAITELDEYYLTRTELEILEDVIPGWVGEFGPAGMVELGAGSARKTRVILDALSGDGPGEVFVPLDVSEDFLREVGGGLRRDYPDLRIVPEVADFTEPLDLAIDLPSPCWFVFLGSTLGNFSMDESERLLRQVRAAMGGEDQLLMGLDLKPGPWKSRDYLEAAYNDVSGLTAEFNRNILRVVRRRSGISLDPDAFEHSAFYDPDRGWIEMRLVSQASQTVELPDGGVLSLSPGEWIRTEISTKYDEDQVREILGRAGLRVSRWAQDPRARFAVLLAEPHR